MKQVAGAGGAEEGKRRQKERGARQSCTGGGQADGGEGGWEDKARGEDMAGFKGCRRARGRSLRPCGVLSAAAYRGQRLFLGC